MLIVSAAGSLKRKHRTGAAAPVSAGTATPVDEDVYIGPGETLTAADDVPGTACGTIAPATTDPAIAVVERGE